MAIQNPAHLPAEHPVVRFQQLFTSLLPNLPMPLEQVYSPQIIFEDPLHHIEGLPALRRYFDRLNAGLVEGQFCFSELFLTPTSAMVPWVMHLTLRRLDHPIVVPGCSHIRFTTHLIYQRDYFDAGALIYEHVPLLGTLIRRIKAAV